MNAGVKLAAAMVLGLWLAAGALAQEAAGSPPVSGDPRGSGPAKKLEKPVMGQEGPSEEEIVLWMDRLRLHDPEEFARLKRLREADPETFRTELRRNFWKRWMEGRPGPPGGPPAAARGMDRDMAELERELLDWVRRHREARDPGERARIREALRARLIEAMNRREALWRTRLEAIRRELDQIEERLRRWEALREEWVERRLSELLGETPVPSAETKPAETP